MTAHEALLDRHYSDRQLIVVTEDKLAEYTDEVQNVENTKKKDGVDWRRLAETAVLDAVPIPFTRLAAEVTREAIRAWARANESGVRVLPVGRKESVSLRFPPGHPRDGIVYVGHPSLPNVYFPMADFHRIMFEQKFCESLELLMALGATEISVQCVKGWGREFSSLISAPLGGSAASVEAEAKGQKTKKVEMLYKATLSGTDAPMAPDDLIWFQHEPTWQTIAKGRMKFGLKDFTLSVTYEDDFGVNGSLKTSLSKAGLNLGGSFHEHQATVWQISGTFGNGSP
ncbi:MAG: hypothetical protein RLW87_19950 [Alphaproteobacteria bacterium]